ncbi:MAG: hypothetical protein V1792_02400 [Pseudomonadota bacterium]
METFTELKEFVANPHFQDQKRKTLAGLTGDMIDAPIIELIDDINSLPYCFTLQCCYGHFLFNGRRDSNNLDPLPVTNTIATVEYRIAYIAFCIDDGESGRELFDDLKAITAIDPQNIRFCCAEWFWGRQVNSFVLQVEPDRFKHEDTAVLDYEEALRIERIRNEFFAHVMRLFKRLNELEFGIQQCRSVWNPIVSL